jgi:hypothetical protein
MNAVGLLLQAGIGVAVYALACNRLSALAQPLRLHWAEMGEALLADPRLPQASRARAASALNDAFNPRSAWLLVAMLPAAAAMVAAETLTGRRTPEEPMPADLRLTYCRFNVWSIFLRLCNSPLALVLAALQFAVFLLLFGPGARLLARLVRFEPPNRFHGGGHGQAA